MLNVSSMDDIRDLNRSSLPSTIPSPGCRVDSLVGRKQDVAGDRNIWPRLYFDGTKNWTLFKSFHAPLSIPGRLPSGSTIAWHTCFPGRKQHAADATRCPAFLVLISPQIGLEPMRRMFRSRAASHFYQLVVGPGIDAQYLFMVPKVPGAPSFSTK